MAFRFEKLTLKNQEAFERPRLWPRIGVISAWNRYTC